MHGDYNPEEEGDTLNYTMQDAETKIRSIVEDRGQDIFFTRKGQLFIFRHKGKTKCWNVTTSGLAEHHCYDMYEKALKVIM